MTLLGFSISALCCLYVCMRLLKTSPRSAYTNRGDARSHARENKQPDKTLYQSIIHHDFPLGPLAAPLGSSSSRFARGLQATMSGPAAFCRPASVEALLAKILTFLSRPRLTIYELLDRGTIENAIALAVDAIH